MAETILRPSLYDTDYCAWLERQAALLRAGRLDEIDVVHLSEELEDIGRSERRALETHLKNVLLHLLKLRYQPERRTASWQLSVSIGRDSIADLLNDNPGLRANLTALIVRQYPRARRDAAVETGLPADRFPSACPFGEDEILGDEGG